ncbi:hypothetical protein IF2G_01309 [Cordyceps javanica]|nr:hypothetical protein IF2G_01309 [Cordyceps javanica]
MAVLERRAGAANTFPLFIKILRGEMNRNIIPPFIVRRTGRCAVLVLSFYVTIVRF